MEIAHLSKNGKSKEDLVLPPKSTLYRCPPPKVLVLFPGYLAVADISGKSTPNQFGLVTLRK